MRLTMTVLLAVVLASGVFGCTAPPDPAVQGESKGESTTPGSAEANKGDIINHAMGELANSAKRANHTKGPQVTFLEYVIIESQIRCVAQQKANQPEELAIATAKVLGHHQVTPAWLEMSRKMARKDGQKSDKARELFDEAGSMVCPGGKPNEELAAIIAAELRSDAAAPSDSGASP